MSIHLEQTALFISNRQLFAASLVCSFTCLTHAAHSWRSHVSDRCFQQVFPLSLMLSVGWLVPLACSLLNRPVTVRCLIQPFHVHNTFRVNRASPGISIPFVLLKFGFFFLQTVLTSPPPPPQQQHVGFLICAPHLAGRFASETSPWPKNSS